MFISLAFQTRLDPDAAWITVDGDKDARSMRRTIRIPQPTLDVTQPHDEMDKRPMGPLSCAAHDPRLKAPRSPAQPRLSSQQNRFFLFHKDVQVSSGFHMMELFLSAN
jgi:hypothetical protein